MIKERCTNNEEFISRVKKMAKKMNSAVLCYTVMDTQLFFLRKKILKNHLTLQGKGIST